MQGKEFVLGQLLMMEAQQLADTTVTFEDDVVPSPQEAKETKYAHIALLGRIFEVMTIDEKVNW